MSNFDEKLNAYLKEIEFPGTKRNSLSEYLDRNEFTEKVMASVKEVNSSRMNIFTWLIFSAFNFLLLVILGSSQFILGDFFLSYPGLSQFFFLFLGLTFFGGLAGLILTKKDNKPLLTNAADTHIA